MINDNKNVFCPKTSLITSVTHTKCYLYFKVSYLVTSYGVWSSMKNTIDQKR